MYSLVSAPVLGFDLARLPGGHRVAEVLLRALAVTADDLPALSRTYSDDAGRDAAWLEVGGGDADVAALEGVVRRASELAAGDEEGAAVAVAALRSASIGTLDRLLSCIRDDVFDWTWERAGAVRLQREDAARAVAVVCDAATASYAQQRLTPVARRRLAASWVAAVRVLPERSLDLGPQEAEVRALLGRAGRLPAADVEALLGMPGGGDWARAVHDASWAVHLSGRVRPAAAAQLLLVQAVHRAGVPLEALAGGAWNALSGAVQAAMVADVLPAPVLDRLHGRVSRVFEG